MESVGSNWFRWISRHENMWSWSRSEDGSGYEPGIAISCTTVQRVTRRGKQTDKFLKGERAISRRSWKGNWKWNRPRFPTALYEMLRPMLLSLEDEDDESLDEWNQEADDRDAPNEYSVEDSDPDMKLGTRWDYEGQHHAIVKRRAVDEDGRPIRSPSNDYCLTIVNMKLNTLIGTQRPLRRIS